MKSFPIRSAIVLGALAFAVAAGEAQAHARLVSATPGPNSSVSPTSTITLHFSEELAPKFSGAEIMKATGPTVASTSTVKDGKVMVLTTSTVLARGTYMVMWHAVASDDGHKTTDSFNFTVH